MAMGRMVFVALCIAAAYGQEAVSEKESGASSGLKMIMKVIDQCETTPDAFKCIKGKALRVVDRALHLDVIPLMDGVTLTKTPGNDRREHARALKDEEVEDVNKVDGLLFDRVMRLIDTHAIKIDMPKMADVKGFNIERIFGEARGTKHFLKKMMGPIIMGLMMKGGLFVLAYKAVALLAGKALMVANVALVLAAVIGLKKLFTPAEKVTYEIVKTPQISHGYSHTSSISALPSNVWESSATYDQGAQQGGGSGGHYRSLEAAAEERSSYAAQALAYAAHIPQHVQHVVVPRPSGTTHVLVGA